MNMNTFTTNDSASKMNGTHLQGYIETRYDHIVERLGEPEHTSGKTNVQWLIEFDDGLVASLYDWKLNNLPTGPYRWHVGGHNDVVVSRLAAILDVPYMQTPF